MRRVRMAQLTAGLAVVAAAAAGCGSSGEPDPPGRPAVFPAFALADSNVNTPTYGQILREDRLHGRAAVVYFGWAT